MNAFKKAWKGVYCIFFFQYRSATAAAIKIV